LTQLSARGDEAGEVELLKWNVVFLNRLLADPSDDGPRRLLAYCSHWTYFGPQRNQPIPELWPVWQGDIEQYRSDSIYHEAKGLNREWLECQVAQLRTESHVGPDLASL
jgi:hypothetical protein